MTQDYELVVKGVRNFEAEFTIQVQQKKKYSSTRI
ncbi:DUF1327 domain-containing protein [Escherichia coli]